MKTKLFFSILLLLFTIGLFAQDTTVDNNNITLAKQPADRIRGIKKVRILVEKFTPQYEELGFSEKKIEEFVVNKLTDNDAYDAKAEPYMYININPISIDKDTFAASVHISLNRPVFYPAEDKTFITMAVLWQSGSIITFPSSSMDYLYDILNKLTDKYLLEWYKSQIPLKEEIIAPADNTSTTAPVDAPTAAQTDTSKPAEVQQAEPAQPAQKPAPEEKKDSKAKSYGPMTA